MTLILDILQGLPPTMQALCGTLFTWLMTALGAAAIFLARQPGRKLQDGMLGFAAGVMIAASYWSLLAPAIELSNGSWMPAVVGFLLGGAFLRGIDVVLPHLHVYANVPEGHHSHWKRSVLLVTAITPICVSCLSALALFPIPLMTMNQRRLNRSWLGTGKQQFR